MVFHINNEIVVINPYSLNDIEYIYSPSLRSLPNPSPRSVSPDGTKLIISSVEAGVGKYRLFVLDLKTGETHKLLYDNASQVFPKWSPDGKHIAFVLMYENESRIYIADLVSDALVRVSGAHKWNYDPCWSPDGNELYFLSYGSDNFTPPKDIFVFNLVGKEIRRLTDDSIRIIDFSLSPDGSRFVFTSYTTKVDIFTMNVDGSNMKNITDDISSERNLVWSTDSSKITFSSERDGNWEIYVMDSGGENLERITHDGGVDTPIQWSPHGEYLAFISDRTESRQIYIYFFSNGEIRQITNEDHYPYLADITTIIEP